MTTAENSKTRAGSSKSEVAVSPIDFRIEEMWQIFKGVYFKIKKEQTSFQSAGIAFFMMISFAPIIVATFSIYGLVGDPSNLAEQFLKIDLALPESSQNFLQTHLSELSKSPKKTLGIRAIISIFISFYSASKASRALILAVNRAYNRKETRSFLKITAYSFLFTIGGIFLMLFVIGAMIVLPSVLSIFQQTHVGDALIVTGQWCILFISTLIAFAILGKFGPNRTPPKWRWILPGSIISSFLCFAVSFGFQYYVNYFNSYDKVYDSIARVILLMIWFYLLSFVIICGAIINSEVEQQNKIPSS